MVVCQVGDFVLDYWGPIALNIVLQIQIAEFHVDKVVKGVQRPVPENGYNILMRFRIAQNGKDSCPVLSGFPRNVFEWTNEFSCE